jgi:hypothetical protein
MNFLRISKSLKTIEDSSGNKVPGKIWGFAKTIGHRPAALRPNSGEPVAGSDRARARNGLRVPGALFPCSDGAEGGPVMAYGGAPERQLRWPAVWRGPMQGGARGGGLSLYRS